MSALDEELERMREAWHAVARYRVVVSEPFTWRHRVIAAGLTWDEATAIAREEDARAAAANPNASSWRLPLAFRELENKDEALAQYRELRRGA